MAGYMPPSTKPRATASGLNDVSQNDATSDVDTSAPGTPQASESDAQTNVLLHSNMSSLHGSGEASPPTHPMRLQRERGGSTKDLPSILECLPTEILQTIAKNLVYRTEQECNVVSLLTFRLASRTIRANIQYIYKTECWSKRTIYFDPEGLQEFVRIARDSDFTSDVLTHLCFKRRIDVNGDPKTDMIYFLFVIMRQWLPRLPKITHLTLDPSPDGKPSLEIWLMHLITAICSTNTRLESICIPHNNEAHVHPLNVTLFCLPTEVATRLTHLKEITMTTYQMGRICNGHPTLRRFPEILHSLPSLKKLCLKLVSHPGLPQYLNDFDRRIADDILAPQLPRATATTLQELDLTGFQIRSWPEANFLMSHFDALTTIRLRECQLISNHGSPEPGWKTVLEKIRQFKHLEMLDLHDISENAQKCHFPGLGVVTCTESDVSSDLEADYWVLVDTPDNYHVVVELWENMGYQIGELLNVLALEERPE